MTAPSPGLWPRKQQAERVRLEPLLAAAPDDGYDAEPMFSQRLCLVIKQYWRLRGHKVEAWVEHQGYSRDNHLVVWRIRSLGIPVTP